MAILYRADLEGAILKDADLSGTDLTGANLSHADLSGAKLGRPSNIGTPTRLMGANLADAKVSNADFRGALCDQHTRFPADFLPEEHGLIWEDEQLDEREN